MADRSLLRLSASLLFIGLLLATVMQFPHPAGGATYEESFANYAAVGVGYWAAVHLAQFVGEAILLAGLLVLYVALNVVAGPARWLAFFGAIGTGVTLALVTVLYAVDGVALKQAVDAWASAPAAEKATWLAGAEAIRWLEFGTNSYTQYARGLALVLYALAIAWTGRIPRPIGLFVGMAGLAFLDAGWLVGTRGFTTADTLPIDAGYGCLFAATLWLLLVAWTVTSGESPTTGPLKGGGRPEESLSRAS